MSTKRIRLVVSYDGTDFRGWAAQTGRRTVQGTLKETVRQVSGEDCEIIGASRTDSGAHAKGQVCHFDTVRPIQMENWKVALNRLLPSDLRVVSVETVPDTFHSRFCAFDRHYRYRIHLGVDDPFRCRFAHGIEKPLDVRTMNEVSQQFVGLHNFLAFTEELPDHIDNTMRRLFKVGVRQVGREVWIDIVGTAFLRGMMRRISGSLLDVGRGKLTEGDIAKLLGEARHGMQWPVVLPANGLTLMKVRYGRHPVDNRLRNEDE